MTIPPQIVDGDIQRQLLSFRDVLHGHVIDCVYGPQARRCLVLIEKPSVRLELDTRKVVARLECLMKPDLGPYKDFRRVWEYPLGQHPSLNLYRVDHTRDALAGIELMIRVKLGDDDGSPSE